MKPVELSPAAKGDLARLEDFLIEKSPRAALGAVRAIRATVQSLGEFPERGVAVGDGRRRQVIASFGRDGYVIRCRVTPTVVLITRIYHGRERR